MDMTNKKTKIAATTISVILILTIICGIVVSTISTDSASASAMYMFMPKELEGEFDGEKVTFYLRKNAEYNPKENSDVMTAFEVYYYDDNGEEVNLGSTGMFEASNQTINPLLLFLVKAGEKFQTLKSIVKKVVITLVVLLIVALIVIWFIVDSRREDEKKKKLNAEKNNNRNKKKKKK